MSTSCRRALLLTAVATVAQAARAGAQTEASPPAQPLVARPVPTTELRIVVGLGVGPEAAKSMFDHRLRLDAGLHAWMGAIGEAAALVRLLGPAHNALWLRGGFMYQRIGVDCLTTPTHWTDTATAWDAGLAYRLRFAGGSLFAAETGFERLSRDRGIYCNDSVLDAQSRGMRFAFTGQYAVTPHLGIHARIGLRTAEHIMELGPLPELWIGVAYEL
jgi:hypothetical protein